MNDTPSSAPKAEKPQPKSSKNFPAQWYDHADEEHFWMQWRFNALMKMFAAEKIPLMTPARGLDIGAGTSAFCRQIEQKSNWVMDGIELNARALQNSPARRGVTMPIDVFHLPRNFFNAYEHVFLFDILEHVEQPVEFLKAALKSLKPGGMLWINVPAFNLFYSRYDQAAGHLRRYTKRMLMDSLDQTEMRCRQLAYWGLSLIPLAVLRKCHVGFLRDEEKIIRSGFKPPSKLINKTLIRIMNLEMRLINKPPAGTSCMMAAQKIKP